MFKISFVILLFCCLTIIQINGQEPKLAECQESGKINGCQCHYKSELYGIKDFCPYKYHYVGDVCTKTWIDQADCGGLQYIPTVTNYGCACL